MLLAHQRFPSLAQTTFSVTAVGCEKDNGARGCQQPREPLEYAAQGGKVFQDMMAVDGIETVRRQTIKFLIAVDYVNAQSSAPKCRAGTRNFKPRHGISRLL